MSLHERTSRLRKDWTGRQEIMRAKRISNLTAGAQQIPSEMDEGHNATHITTRAAFAPREQVTLD